MSKLDKDWKEAINRIIIVLIIINIGFAFNYMIWFNVQQILIFITIGQIILNIAVIIAGIISKYKIRNERSWNNPIICDGCNKEVESISRNPILGQSKWLCKNCVEVN